MAISNCMKTAMHYSALAGPPESGLKPTVSRPSLSGTAMARRLPAVFCIENNQTALSTPVCDQSAVRVFADKAAGYGVHGECCDGNDVLAVYDMTRRAVARARAGGGASLLEVMTYRRKGHAEHDTQSYVPAQELAEFAGRLCYLSFGPDAGFEGGHKLIPGRTTNSEYLANILRTRHGSVLEHAVWTLLFEGVSRALTHELVRHRHLSYSQLSQRYVDESEVAFVLPPEIEPDGETYELFRQSCERALQDYRALLARIEQQVKDERVWKTFHRELRVCHYPRLYHPVKRFQRLAHKIMGQLQ